MKLWILRPEEGLSDTKNNPWDPWYDKAFGFVIRAETEQRAREIANENGGCETERHPRYKTKKLCDCPWLDPTLSSCIELTSDGVEEMVIRDFAAA